MGPITDVADGDLVLRACAEMPVLIGGSGMHCEGRAFGSVKRVRPNRKTPAHLAGHGGGGKGGGGFSLGQGSGRGLRSRLMMNAPV